MFKHGVIFLVFLTYLPSYGALFSPQLVQKAARITVLFGSYDPVHLGHRNLAELALERDRADLSLVIPLLNPRKTLTPLELRLEMLKLEFLADPKIGIPQLEDYPDPVDQKAWIQKLKDINPTASISLAMGDDVPTDKLLKKMNSIPGVDRIFIIDRPPPEVRPSSTQVRRQLKELRAGSEVSLNLLSKPVLDFILSRHLYEGYPAENTKLEIERSRIRRFISDHIAKPLGISFFRSVARPRLSEIERMKALNFELSNSVDQIEPLPCGGLSACFRVEQTDGSEWVLKLPKNDQNKGKMVFESLGESSALLQQMEPFFEGSLRIPESRSDVRPPFAHWTRLVPGLTIAQTMKQRDLSAQELRALRLAYEKVKLFYQTTGATIDFTPDNLIFNSDGLWLVDLGFRYHRLDLDSFESMLYRWKISSRLTMLIDAIPCLKLLLRSGR